jgi:UDP-GlcNAc:undecaprenyl-phosphate/decaprenyl-phosphate GlcNAc-1-phosphate transferase
MLIEKLHLIIFLILLIINFIIYYKINYLNKFLNIYDLPNNKRKIHKTKIAKTGGVIIFFNLSLLFISNHLFNNFLEFQNISFLNLVYIGITFFFLSGLIDDVYDLNPNLKLFLSAIFLLIILIYDDNLSINIIKLSFFKTEIDLDDYSIVFSILCILLFINAINMFDGINLQTILYSTLLVVANLFLMDKSIFILYLSPLIICLMVLNYKNELFLGDNGTLLIGFTLSCLFIINYSNSSILFADTIFIFMMLPGLEVLRLAVSRILKKRNPFSADKTHIHHLLLKKISYNTTIILNFWFILIPILLDYYTNMNNLYLIFGYIVIYFYGVYKLSKY